MKLYGIKTCASVKKAKAFFDENSIIYDFIDLSKQPIGEDKIQYWLNFEEAKSFFNPRSKAYREYKLKGKDLNSDTNIKLLSSDNALLKRPIIEHGLNGEEKLTVGFDEKTYCQCFLAN